MTRSAKKTPEPLIFKGHYAGFVTRLVAFVIDTLVISLSISLMWAVLTLILRFFNLELLVELTAVSSPVMRGILLFFTGFGFTFTLNLIYNIFFWMLAGKTLGKAVMGIRVVGPRGSRVTFWRAVRRSVGYWLSALPFFLGFFWVLITDERTAWHDRFAGTRVIYDHEVKYSEALLGRLAHVAPRLEEKRQRVKPEE